MSEMKFGIKLPNCAGVICDPDLARPEHIDAIAKTAEALGYDSVWLHDHLATPDELRPLSQPDFYEPLMVMGRLAALTSRLRLGVATVILPLRDPVLVAKQVATVDGFAPGRVILGVGAGRYEDEFLSLGSDAYPARGRITDEYIRIIRALWRDDEVTFSGTYRTLARAKVYPKPQTPPPIWIGGNSAAAIRRAARVGDGWVPAALTVEEVAAGRRQLEETARRHDRDPGRLEIGLSLTVELTRPGRETARSLHGHPSSKRVAGEPEQVIERLQEYGGAGVSTFLLSFSARDVAETVEHMAAFAEQIVQLQ